MRSSTPTALINIASVSFARTRQKSKTHRLKTRWQHVRRKKVDHGRQSFQICGHVVELTFAENKKHRYSRIIAHPLRSSSKNRRRRHHYHDPQGRERSFSRHPFSNRHLLQHKIPLLTSTLFSHSVHPSFLVKFKSNRYPSRINAFLLDMVNSCTAVSTTPGECRKVAIKWQSSWRRSTLKGKPPHLRSI